MRKLLLTGFEPFLGFSINPTTGITRSLDGSQINNFDIIGEVLTVDFHQSGQQLLELIDKHKPDAVISLGLAAGRNCVTPERIAINCNDGPVDNNGHKPNGEKVFNDGPDAYFSTLPIYQLVEHMQTAGFPAKISNTAGTYLCNNVMYHGLHKFNGQAGFIHLPASHALAIEKNMPSWSQNDLLEAVGIAINCL